MEEVFVRGSLDVYRKFSDNGRYGYLDSPEARIRTVSTFLTHYDAVHKTNLANDLLSRRKEGCMYHFWPETHLLSCWVVGVLTNRYVTMHTPGPVKIDDAWTISVETQKVIANYVVEKAIASDGSLYFTRSIPSWSRNTYCE